MSHCSQCATKDAEIAKQLASWKAEEVIWHDRIEALRMALQRFVDQAPNAPVEVEGHAWPAGWMLRHQRAIQVASEVLADEAKARGEGT